MALCSMSDLSQQSKVSVFRGLDLGGLGFSAPFSRGNGNLTGRWVLHFLRWCSLGVIAVPFTFLKVISSPCEAALNPKP